MSSNNWLIVGLGNPGEEYKNTRHNVGADFVTLLSSHLKISLTKEEKLSSHYGRKILNNTKIHLAIPSVYMNESGQTIQKFKKYLKINLKDILIVHDDLDLPIGKIKLKDSGGHGGHNGIRNIIDKLQGNASFKRLRIGIDHPIKSKDVTKYVLSKSPKRERKILESAMQNAVPTIDKMIAGNWQEAVLGLHSKD